MLPETYLIWFGHIANLCGVIAAVYSVRVWLRLRFLERRQREEISISVTNRDTGQTFTLPYRPRRRDVSRSEVLGLLGMIPPREEGKRFHMKESFAIMAQLTHVLDGASDHLNIPLGAYEFDQFDLSSVSAVGVAS